MHGFCSRRELVAVEGQALQPSGGSDVDEQLLETRRLEVTVCEIEDLQLRLLDSVLVLWTLFILQRVLVLRCVDRSEGLRDDDDALVAYRVRAEVQLRQELIHLQDLLEVLAALWRADLVLAQVEDSKSWLNCGVLESLQHHSHSCLLQKKASEVQHLQRLVIGQQRLQTLQSLLAQFVSEFALVAFGADVQVNERAVALECLEQRLEPCVADAVRAQIQLDELAPSVSKDSSDAGHAFVAKVVGAQTILAEAGVVQHDERHDSR